MSILSDNLSDNIRVKHEFSNEDDIIAKSYFKEY